MIDCGITEEMAGIIMSGNGASGTAQRIVCTQGLAQPYIEALDSYTTYMSLGLV